MSITNSKQKTFSIITVAYNAERLIEDTMRSIFSQSYADYEYIVIDGKSTDDTMSVIEKYRDKIDILISEPDNGIYDAMNKGICLASGRYINFMNCGDFFADESVLECVKEITIDNPDVIYGSTIINTIIGKYLVYPDNLEKVIYKQMPFCHQSTFVKLEVAQTHLFDTDYKAVADYNLFLHLYEEGKNFVYLDKPIAIYQNDGGTSRQSYKRVLESAMVNKRHSTKIKALYKYIGGYLRKLLPFSLYIIYRKTKYACNPRLVFLGNESDDKEDKRGS